MYPSSANRLSSSLNCATSSTIWTGSCWAFSKAAAVTDDLRLDVGAWPASRGSVDVAMAMSVFAMESREPELDHRGEKKVKGFATKWKTLIM